MTLLYKFLTYLFPHQIQIQFQFYSRPQILIIVDTFRLTFTDFYPFPRGMAVAMRSPNISMHF